MIYQGTSDLIWQPDIRVSAFPSGLLLVQRSCKARKSEYSNAPKDGDLMPDVESSGAIDPVYIFQTPQLAQQDAAFFKWEVSAYSRWTTVPNVAKQSAFRANYTIISERRVLSFVVNSSDIILPSKYTPTDPLKIYFANGTEVINSVYGIWTVENFERTEYGAYSEVSMTFGSPFFA
jgi:hypothetical protein